LSGCACGEEKEDRAKPQSATEDCEEGHFVGSWIEAVDAIEDRSAVCVTRAEAARPECIPALRM
jgi:hypothetical protein